MEDVILHEEVTRDLRRSAIFLVRGVDRTVQVAVSHRNPGGNVEPNVLHAARRGPVDDRPDALHPAVQGVVEINAVHRTAIAAVIEGHILDADALDC